MKTAKVSVILPCFNHARFLEERIRSVLSQTSPIDQIIFLDDASTDGSVEIARRLLRQSSIDTHFIVNEVNSGSPFNQWNLGVEQALHDIIWIAETDDSCDPQFLEVVLGRLMEPDTVLSYSQSKIINEKGVGFQVPNLNGVFPGQFDRNFTMAGSEFRNRFLSIRNVIPNASGVVFKKEAFVQAGMANPTMRNCGDWDMWVRMAEFGAFSYTSLALNHFRSHDATTRLPGFKPYARAESIAILYYTTNQVIDATKDRITLPVLIKAFLTQKFLNWERLCKEGNCNKTGVIRKHYLHLRRVPKISIGVWMVMAACNLLYRITKALYHFIR